MLRAMRRVGREWVRAVGWIRLRRKWERRTRWQRERIRRQRLSVPTHPIEAKAQKWALMIATTAVKRVHVRINAQTPTALPSEWTPNATKPAIVNI